MKQNVSLEETNCFAYWNCQETTWFTVC